MFPSNLPILQQMLGDARYVEFAAEMDELFRGDPQYTPRKLRTLLDGAARGERIVPFEGRYVINSSVPPIPSRAFLTFLAGGVDRQRLFSDLAYARRSAPLSAHLCITSRCSYRCRHCGWTVLDRDAELKTNQWVGVIRDLQDSGAAFLVFSGGEPLLREDIEEIVAAVDERSTTLLFTNGRALTLQRARALKESGLFILAVSLDSPDPEEHNRIRQHPRAFDHALAAIRNAAAAGLYTLVSSVVFSRHLRKEYLFRLFRLAREHGAHEVRIHQPIPRGELSDPQGVEGVFYTPQDITRLYRIQFAANQTREGLPKVSSLPYTEGPRKFGCGAGVLHSYISATGDLWPCDFVPLRIGNVVREDLREVYGRMLAASGVPKNHCWARTLAGQLHGEKVPLGSEESIALCRSCRSRFYPAFFRDLQAR